MAASTNLQQRLAVALSDRDAANELATQLGVAVALTVSDSITARSGGGKASATQLVAGINRVTTVAANNDSVLMPAATAGLVVYVINAGSKPMQVFGQGSDTINGVATATGVEQQPGLSLYTCLTAGAWQTGSLGRGIHDNGNSASGTVTLDLSVSDVHLLTLTGTPTLALSNVGTVRQFTVILAQDGTGSRTVTWFSGIAWSGGSPPTLTTTASKRDILTFTNLGGGVYLGTVAGQNY